MTSQSLHIMLTGGTVSPHWDQSHRCCLSSACDLCGHSGIEPEAASCWLSLQLLAFSTVGLLFNSCSSGEKAIGKLSTIWAIFLQTTCNTWMWPVTGLSRWGKSLPTSCPLPPQGYTHNIYINYCPLPPHLYTHNVYINYAERHYPGLWLIGRMLAW